MSPFSRLLFICLFLTLAGCTGSSGQYYLKTENYREGIRTFKQLHAESPDNPRVNYYLGRFYLADEQPEEAVAYLKHASQIAADQADNHFWLGVAYWAVMDFEAEYQSYLLALKADPNHMPARLYLANNLLDRGKWESALQTYEQVLEKEPNHPEALYNRALALQQLGNPANEIKAWKRYLESFPCGRWALRAVDHLNAHGDVSYRNFTIGYRKVTLRPIAFKSQSSELVSTSNPSLQVIGSILENNRGIELNIIAYFNGKKSIAFDRAEAIRAYILRSFPQIRSSRIAIMGKGISEKFKASNQTYFFDESVVFITTKK